VLSQNSIRHQSSGIAMIEVEQCAQPFTPPDGPDRMIVLLRREQPVAEPLMIPFEMVVRDVFTHSSLKMALAHGNNPVEASRPAA